MITAKNIHFCVRRRPILDQVNITIHPGEVVAVLGPNGAGKSTLLRLLTGEQKCDQAEMSINDLPLARLKPVELASMRAVMPQHSQVYFSYTAGEVIALGGILHQSKVQSRKLMEEVMALTGTKALEESMLEELSGGERQRVQLARVLLQIWEPKPQARYLFLDEPTSSMDIAQQHQVLQLIRQVKERNIGVLAVLHDLNLAAQYADRVLLLKEGKVMHFGPTRKIMTTQKLTEVYGHPISVMPHPLDDKQVIITSETTLRQQTYTSFKSA